MGKSLKPEYIKRLNLEESIQIDELIKNRDYSNALSLAFKAIRRNKNNHKELGRFQELRLKALLGLGVYDDVIKLAFEYEYQFKERQFNFLMIELCAKIGKGNSQEVLDELPKLFSLYPNEYINLENIKIEALFEEKRYLEVIEEAEMMSQKYQGLSPKYDDIKIDALINLNMYEEAFEEISNCVEKYPTLAKKFLNKRIQVYKKSGEYNLALAEIDRLEKKYPEDQKRYDKEKKKILREQRMTEKDEEISRKKISASKLKYLLELDEETFMKALSRVGMEEAVFLLSVRYKFEGSNTLALGCIDEYEKRAKENLDIDFASSLRKEIKTKTKIFDMRNWTKKANKLGLNFEGLQENSIQEDYTI